MDIKLPEKVTRIMKIFKSAQADIFVVGGAVRDVMLNREIKDWDFTTNLTPEEMKKLFPKNSFCENAFGTFSIVVDKNEIFEVTTYRTEKGYSDNRHPDEIKWGKSLEEDLQRRDFTINAMAIDIDGKIYDFYDGQKDLENKIIKTVGNPDERFGEDALRMMRAVRIASQISFVIEEKTFESIQKNAKFINNITGERVRDELFLLLKSKKPGDAIILLKNLGLLAQIIPELMEGVDVKQKGHHIYDVWRHSLEALNSCQSNDPITRLATLLHDVGKPKALKVEGEERTFYNHEIIGSRIAVKVGKRLKLSNKELDKLFRLVRWHMFTVEDTQTDKAVRRFIRNVTPEYLDNMIAVRRSDRIGSGSQETSWRWELFKQRLVEVQKQPFSVKDMKVNGEDVMNLLNIKPSRKVGEILNSLFAQVEENPSLNEREILLQKIKNIKVDNIK